MDETKTLGYDWEFGHEELAIEVNSYYNGGLYIGLYKMEGGEYSSFGDLTVNLPCGCYNEVNEAFIDDFCSKSKLEFIKKHKLGKVLPEKGYSGMTAYSMVAFNLERLAELDRDCMKEYRQLHDLPEKKVPKRKRNTERER